MKSKSASMRLIGIKNLTAQYPVWTIAVALLLIYAAPFTSNLLVYPAFLLCVYRVVVYDARVFATDYCLLVPLASIFTATGMSLFVYLCLFAGIWYMIRDNLVFSSAHVCLLLLLNYLILRMLWNISDFLLCFGQFFLLCILLPQQDEESAARTAKLFCIGLLLSSLYGLVFRDAAQIRSLCGQEDEANWGTQVMRFQGLFRDPNYYMTLLVTAIALLAKLRDSRRIGIVPFLVLVVCTSVFGFLTYSKTFLIAIILLTVIGIIWLFRNGHYVWGGLASVATAVGGGVLFAVSTVINDLLLRFSSATNVSELTTGRTEVYIKYMKLITEDVSSFLFGYGLVDSGLKMDAHSIFIEILYHLGIVGIALIIAYCVALISIMKTKICGQKQRFIAKYVVLFVVVLLHGTLHGIFSLTFYPLLFLALSSMLITKKTDSLAESAQ